MKITDNQLRKIIREELSRMISEEKAGVLKESKPAHAGKGWYIEHEIDGSEYDDMKFVFRDRGDYNPMAQGYITDPAALRQLASALEGMMSNKAYLPLGELVLKMTTE